MSSVTPSPVGSRRRSSGQRSPAGNLSVPPPPSGPAASRSASRHRNPAGTQNSWPATTGSAPHPRPSPQPYHPTPTPGLGPSPRPPTGPSPALQYNSSGQMVAWHSAGHAETTGLPSGAPPIPPVSVHAFGPSMMSTTGARRKRLIVACDGTWKSADSANLHGDATVPSNVVHLTRAIKSISRDGISQVVFYQAGVGTEGGPINRLIGGATAKGLEDDILQGYYWLCQNWMLGDEIFLFGFSRGAFTARSIAGMIDGVGLLTREGIKYANVIFRDFENRNNPRYRSDHPDQPFKRKPSAADPRYADLLERNKLSRLNVVIKAVAVFETVGSLGIPHIPLLERLNLQSRGTKEYEFYDTSLGSHIEHAFQALALDELRAPFSPSVWEKGENNSTDLRQVWFPGVHTNVGGGYLDTNLSNISLAWMMAQLTPLLDLDDGYILEQAEQNAQYYTKVMDERPRAWSLGRLYNSLTGIWVIGGRRARTPGMYTRVSPTGVPTDKPLHQTNEYIHASARSRFVLDGTSYRDIGTYRPVGLEAYRLRLTGSEAESGGRGGVVAVWESRRKGRNGPKKVLAEAPIFEIERRLLGLSPRVEHVVLRPQQAEAEMTASQKQPRHSRRRDQNNVPHFDEEKMSSRASI